MDAVINKKDDVTDSHILTISIKDNGKGIDPNIMHKLFTKFTTSGSDKGTGIGLYLSKKIIEAHGGTIRAYNNVEEKGATFSFSIPDKTHKSYTFEDITNDERILEAKEEERRRTFHNKYTTKLKT